MEIKGQQKESWVLCATTWIPELKIRSLGLMASAFDLPRSLAGPSNYSWGCKSGVELLPSMVDSFRFNSQYHNQLISPSNLWLITVYMGKKNT